MLALYRAYASEAGSQIPSPYLTLTPTLSHLNGRGSNNDHEFTTEYIAKFPMVTDLTEMKQQEWLEADGLGGFASGTVSGIRTRRYHALLLTATKPPAGRIVLVNGFDASVETTSGNYAISSQLYAPDVTHPDGASRISEFTTDFWPRWIFSLPDGTKIQQEIFVVHGPHRSLFSLGGY